MRAALCLVVLLAAAAGSAAARRVEVYGFSVANTPTYKGYDWEVLTTSAWRTDPELIELAHRHGARVELNAGDVSEVMRDAAKRKQWVQSKLVEMVKVKADGINFDLEKEIKAGSQEAADYTALVKLAADELHAAIPGSTVSVDVPWSPYDIDGRSYDFTGLAAAADLLFVMVYDTQSQILGRCIASANSPLDTVRKGVQHWLDLGVPRHKLVLGLPWYAYDYECQGKAPGTPPPADVDFCVLKPVPFRGVSCSDAAGVQKCYWEVMELLAGAVNTTDVRWDQTQQSPYFNYRAKDGSIHQVHFDSPESLALKYQVAVDNQLAGIGFWNLDCLDYASTDERVRGQTRDMWGAVRTAVAAFKRRERARPGDQL